MEAQNKVTARRGRSAGRRGTLEDYVPESSAPPARDLVSAAEFLQGTGHWLALDKCRPNPRNRDVGDVSDLASIKKRQLQSCRGITSAAYLRLWSDDSDVLDAGPEDVVIINGNRRLAAARKYGRADLFVLVDDSIATSRAAVRRAAYDENTARKDFDAIEEAKAVMDIVSEYPTAKEAARAEGWSEPWISHRKNLLKLHPQLQQEIRARSHDKEAAGISINVARRLGAMKGIKEMGLTEQRAALADLLRSDAEAAKTVKAARRKVKQMPVADARTGSDTTSAKKFSAENSSPPPWLMPDEAVRSFSQHFHGKAQETGRAPEVVMWEAFTAIRASSGQDAS
ncbi:ParB/RepB/Spo0J family partition protein [Streptomyces sp. NPDC087298]|uniref:ParB/RepB/Spo0J family partition protein n=1 Tax=Streptomyces sp. NPDC087298 TaxID=3365779 RepID=UPI00380967AE